MITVEQAFDKIVGAAKPLSTEKRPVAEASGFVLASPLNARRSQPGAPLSAMDGYAVDSKLMKGEPVKLPVVGVSAAGMPAQEIQEGTAMRIYTGAILPVGADQIVIQENVTREGDEIITAQPSEAGRHIRFEGIDFNEKQLVLDAGTYLSAKSIGLAAAAGFAHVMVHRAPVVAILSSGDEIVDPGSKSYAPHQTINSIAPQLAAYLSDAGAQIMDLGTAKDDLGDLESRIEKAKEADILITIGGASVGDRDFMGKALQNAGMELDFWKVAMRPGKPVISGKIGNTHVMGLPGNPVSAFVGAMIFVRPLVDKLMGRPAPMPTGVMLPSAADIPENNARVHYMRARLVGEAGSRTVDPAASQDSSLQSVLAQCDGLLVREANAKAIKVGELVPFIPF